MADSILSFDEMEAALDNIAHSTRKMTAGVGESFAATPGLVNEGTDSLIYGLRALAETDMRAWTSDDAISKAQAAAHAALTSVYTGEGNIDGTIRLLAGLYGPTIKGLMNHWATYQPQTTGYENFWNTWATLWAADGSTANKKCVLGEVVQLMRANGIGVDPDYCVPPEEFKIGLIEGAAAAATLTAYNTVDPLVFAGAFTAELYCVTRNAAPGTITLVIANAKDEDDGPEDDGATSFTATIANTVAAGDTVDLAQADSHILQSVSGASVSTFTNGQADDDFIIRVKQFRASGY